MNSAEVLVEKEAYPQSAEQNSAATVGFREKIRSWREFAFKATGMVLGIAAMMVGAYVIGTLPSDSIIGVATAVGLVAGGFYLAFKDREMRPGGGH